MSNFNARHFHFIDDLDIAALALGAIERVEAFAIMVGGTMLRWQRRAQERRALAAMSEQMLDDIGLTRGQVEREAARYFWQK